MACYLDDILITAKTQSLHLQRLDEVLSRLERYGIRLKLSKCRFMQDQIDYLGHTVSSEGLRPIVEKIAALKEAPTPTNVTELRSYLGLLKYYAKFLPDLSSLLAPLHALTHSDVEWSWTSECEQVFKRSKTLICGADILCHYDSSKPMKLACDASSYGLGAVISHISPDGTEKPIAFASRTMTSAEKNYSQVEREALANIFGVKRFRQYLWGRHFTLETDHRPLVTILGPKNGIPTMTAARLQRWALILSGYTYEIEYRPGSELCHADAFSRLPVNAPTNSAEEESDDIFHFTCVDELPVSSRQIRESTRKHPLLAKVLDFTMTGWPERVTDDALTPYFIRRHELSVEQGCLLWGLRVVVPPIWRKRLMDDLHEGHMGMTRMKGVARSFLWWPGLDQDIESCVRECAVCMATRNTPPVVPLETWSWPLRPWQRIHLDYAEKDGNYFLVLIDSHTKWIEVFKMHLTTSTKTIDILRDLFAAHGLPEEVVSDNGPQFTSHEFREFLRLNGIKQTLVPPYHPASNGAAERSVGLLKQALLKDVLEAKYGGVRISLRHRLANFLLRYRNTPHSVTGRTPSELFLKRQVRTRFSMLRPDLRSDVQDRQARQKVTHDRAGVSERRFDLQQDVAVRNNRGGPAKWLAGRIVEVKGPRTYIVRVSGCNRFVHADQLMTTSVRKNEGCRDMPVPGVASALPTPTRQHEAEHRFAPDDAPIAVTENDGRDDVTEIVMSPARAGIATPQRETIDTTDELKTTQPAIEGANVPRRRYPSRYRKPVERLDL